MLKQSLIIASCLTALMIASPEVHAEESTDTDSYTTSDENHSNRRHKMKQAKERIGEYRRQQCDEGESCENRSHKGKKGKGKHGEYRKKIRQALAKIPKDELTADKVRAIFKKYKAKNGKNIEIGKVSVKDGVVSVEITRTITIDTNKRKGPNNRKDGEGPRKKRHSNEDEES